LLLSSDTVRAILGGDDWESRLGLGGIGGAEGEVVGAVGSGGTGVSERCGDACDRIDGVCERIEGVCDRIDGVCERIDGVCDRVMEGGAGVVDRRDVLLLLMDTDRVWWLLVVPEELNRESGEELYGVGEVDGGVGD
jgi:hypothetical protein